jgi:tetratricopeptide (TPR) repeat protein
MAFEVFISHASGDAVLAQAIVQRLEAAEIQCWIAPRDIVPGTDYAQSIIEAIETVAVMVVVVSDDANRSRHVPREVERAVALDVSLVPFRIADIEPSKTLQYFLSSQHWLHALPPPVEVHIGKLVDAVAALLALRRSASLALPVFELGQVRARPVRVPPPVPVFTGRDAERVELASALGEFPIVTLLGPPGVGKTELARVAIADVADRVAVYVDLSAVAVAGALAAVVTAACGLDPATNWDQTLAALSANATLVLLDNCETALAVDAHAFRELLRGMLGQGVRVLATSRERLGVAGAERVVRVGPLPPTDSERLLDRLLYGNAVSIDPAELSAVAGIREVADGLPLALVVSAAWLAEVSPSAYLAAWWRSRATLSTLPGFDEPDRWSSVDVSVAVSFDSVGGDARRAMQALSLLPAGAPGELVGQLLGGDAFDQMALLSRRSLVERSGSVYRLLVPIREFVRDRTPAAIIEPLLVNAIAAYTAQLRRITGSVYRAGSNAEWDRLGGTLANVGALIDDGLEQPAAKGAAVDLAVTAALAFRATGRITEGVEHLDKALSATPGGEVRGKLLEERAHILRAGARLTAAVAAYDAALDIWMIAQRADREAVCRLRLGDVQRTLARYPAAYDNYARAERLYEDLDDPLGLADAYECLGDVACMKGDFAHAVGRYEQAQDIFRSLPEGLVGMGNTAHSLGDTRLASGDLDGARLDYDQAHAIATRIGDPQGQGNALLGLAKIRLQSGRYDEARTDVTAAQVLYRGIDDRLGLANVQIALGDLAAATGELSDADRAYAEAEIALIAMACPANRILASLRRVLARQLAWDSPQVVRVRDEFARLVDRPVDVEECRRWPLERRGFGFHGSLELSS